MAHDKISGFIVSVLQQISEILSCSAFGNQCVVFTPLYLFIQQILIVPLLCARNIVGDRARIESRQLSSHHVHCIMLSILLSP